MPVLAYQCPNCGGDLKFNPALQKCKCDYCRSTFTVEELEDMPKPDQTDTPPDQQEQNLEQQTITYSCPNCGAQMIADKVSVVAFCVYCGNSNVITEQISSNFAPSKIIPFKIEKKDAAEKLKSWCDKRWFLPGSFKSQTEVEKISGVYIPYWLFTCDTTNQMSATAKNVKTWRAGNYKYTKTDHYSVFRQADMRFNNVPCDASKNMNHKVMEAIEPFDYTDLRKFSLNFLAGFLAERYHIEQDSAFANVKNRIQAAANSILRNSIKGYTMVQVTNSNTAYNRVTSHYALLPIWMFTYVFNKKKYVFAMNGQTGKIFGKLPLSWHKLLLLFFALLVLVFGVLFGVVVLLEVYP